ncbi:putative tyrosinase [Cladorrhinum samala]|uniref:Tyrosinase n=1 Tax=Cladorrhinum samala TaxID=585594 RepID=A0AAV9HZ49_9PEZI|nr:putative tyrosinase [Cladorrhinum samala]
MRSSLLFSLAGSAVLSVSAAKYKPSSTAQTDVLAAEALTKLTLHAGLNSKHSACNSKNVARRREWGSLNPPERRAYIAAVKCLMAKPSALDPVQVPGAKSRFDDFVAIHINQTFEIHGTASFLSWHRYFTWTYEQALRSECNYEGWQPYWNWGKSAHDPLGSPIFDGSDTSMSGNGAYYPHNCTDALANGINCIPPGTGGGCVESGPFAEMTVNLGLLAPTLRADNIAVNLTDGLFGHKPRCLRRDISQWVSSRWSTDLESYDLLTNYPTIGSFQNHMQGDFPNGFYGVHAAGHYTIGGDPGGDFFSSPGDPAFYLHHAQVDRTWWIWQNLDPGARTNAIDGITSLLSPPPGINGTLEDILDMGVFNSLAQGPRPIADLMSTVGQGGGPLCYIYV